MNGYVQKWVWRAESPTISAIASASGAWKDLNEQQNREGCPSRLFYEINSLELLGGCRGEDPLDKAGHVRPRRRR